jgi:hypothetical protein
VEAYRAVGSAVDHSIERADAIGDLIVQPSPDTVAAVFIEPVQNSGGCLVAEPDYFSRPRSIWNEPTFSWFLSRRFAPGAGWGPRSDARRWPTRPTSS